MAGCNTHWSFFHVLPHIKHFHGMASRRDALIIFMYKHNQEFKNISLSKAYKQNMVGFFKITLECAVLRDPSEYPRLVPETWVIRRLDICVPDWRAMPAAECDLSAHL